MALQTNKSKEVMTTVTQHKSKPVIQSEKPAQHPIRKPAQHPLSEVFDKQMNRVGASFIECSARWKRLDFQGLWSETQLCALSSQKCNMNDGPKTYKSFVPNNFWSLRRGVKQSESPL